MKQLSVIFLFMLLCQGNCDSRTIDNFAVSEYNEISAPADDSVLDDKGAENKVLEDALRSFNLDAQSNLAATDNKNNSLFNTSEFYCDEECQKSRKFAGDLKRTRRWTPSQITTSSCKLDLLHEICEPAGEEISPGKLSMCRTCRRLYKVSDNCHPRYLRAEVCQGSNDGCAFDNGKAHGTCISTTSLVTLLRNVGDDNCRKFLPEDFEMPSGCQCALNKQSPLRATPDA